MNGKQNGDNGAWPKVMCEPPKKIKQHSVWRQNARFIDEARLPRHKKLIVSWGSKTGDRMNVAYSAVVEKPTDVRQFKPMEACTLS